MFRWDLDNFFRMLAYLPKPVGYSQACLKPSLYLLVILYFLCEEQCNFLFRHLAPVFQQLISIGKLITTEFKCVSTNKQYSEVYLQTTNCSSPLRIVVKVSFVFRRALHSDVIAAIFKLCFSISLDFKSTCCFSA